MNDKTREEREREFLIGLAKLTRETGIIIGGCGCCGSPWITPAIEQELNDPDAGYALTDGSEGVTWVSNADEFDFRRLKDRIVR